MVNELNKEEPDIQEPDIQEPGPKKLLNIGINQASETPYSKDRLSSLAYETALDLKTSLKVELQTKSQLRKRLVASLGFYFSLITMVVFFIIIFLNEVVHHDIQKYLVTGLFANLFGLLMVLYRYAFSDTDKIMQNISELLH